MNTHITKNTTQQTNTSGKRIRNEEWRTIAVAPKYEVSNKGRIRNITTGRVLKTNINPNTGYEQATLFTGEANITKVVHRLVAIAFLPNPNNLEQVDHIDSIKTHNSVSNLRWVSRKFNNSRKRAKMLKSQNRTNTSHTHQFVKASKGDEVKYFKTINVAAKQLGFSHVLGIKVIRGEFKSAKGWKLEYIDRKSDEGINANIDVRTKRELRRDLKSELKAKRKARIKEMKLPPRMAHCVMGLNPITQEIAVLYPNAYKAEQDLGIKGVYNAALGLNNRLVGGLVWDWLFA